MSTSIVVKISPFLHLSASLSLMTCIQVPWLQQIASGGNKSPRPPVYESLDWTAPNVLWWNIALGKKPQVEIVTAFSSLAKEKFGRLDSYFHFQTICLPIVGGCWCVFDVPGPCKFLKCCRNELRTIVAYKFAGTAMSCKILSLWFVLNLEVISGAYCFWQELTSDHSDNFLLCFATRCFKGFTDPN